MTVSESNGQDGRAGRTDGHRAAGDIAAPSPCVRSADILRRRARPERAAGRVGGLRSRGAAAVVSDTRHFRRRVTKPRFIVAEPRRRRLLLLPLRAITRP